MRLKNKVTIVTGGGTGIGKAISTLFSKEGAKVIIASRKTHGKMIKGVSFIKTDITKISDIKRLIQKVIKRYGKIDILINNAGYIKQTRFEKTTEKIWDKKINTNLKGTFFLTKEVIPYMRQRNFGRIVNISSIAGIRGSLISAAYADSKAGIISLTKTLAREYDKYNILITCIAPGPTKTPMMKRIKIQFSEEQIMDPEEISKTALYLVLQNSKRLNGKIIIKSKI